MIPSNRKDDQFSYINQTSLDSSSMIMPSTNVGLKHERIFVEFFIPPPPPTSSDVESSDSELTSHDEGYEICGLNCGKDILELSTAIVNNSTTDGKKKERKNVKKIQIDGLISGTDDSELDSEVTETDLKTRPTRVRRINSSIKDASGENIDHGKVIRRIRRESSISLRTSENLSDFRSESDSDLSANQKPAPSESESSNSWDTSSSSSLEQTFPLSKDDSMIIVSKPTQSEAAFCPVSNSLKIVPKPDTSETLQAIPEVQQKPQNTEKEEADDAQLRECSPIIIEHTSPTVSPQDADTSVKSSANFSDHSRSPSKRHRSLSPCSLSAMDDTTSPHTYRLQSPQGNKGGDMGKTIFERVMSPNPAKSPVKDDDSTSGTTESASAHDRSPTDSKHSISSCLTGKTSQNSSRTHIRTTKTRSTVLSGGHGAFDSLRYTEKDGKRRFFDTDEESAQRADEEKTIPPQDLASDRLLHHGSTSSVDDVESQQKQKMSTTPLPDEIEDNDSETKMLDNLDVVMEDDMINEMDLLETRGSATTQEKDPNSVDVTSSRSRSPISHPTSQNTSPQALSPSGVNDDGEDHVSVSMMRRKRLSISIGGGVTPITELHGRKRNGSRLNALMLNHEENFSSRNGVLNELDDDKLESFLNSDMDQSSDATPIKERGEIIDFISGSTSSYDTSSKLEHETSSDNIPLATSTQKVGDMTEGTSSDDDMNTRRLRRVGRFCKDSIMIDRQKDLMEDVKVGRLDRITDIINELVASLKVNHQLVYEMSIDDIFDSVRRLLVINNTFIRCSALRLIKYMCVDEKVTSKMLSYKLNVFIIMSLERSERLKYERYNALSLVSYLIDSFTHLIPRSLIISILCIANDATDLLRTACLKLTLQLIIHVPERVVFCDGVQVLLNGCVETSNCSLLQSSILACLYYLNDSRFRQKKTILDLQIILDPLLIESKSVPDSKLEELRVSRYISNVAMLTILRTWSGIFIFSGDFNGLNSYLNILSTHGEEEPELARQMLSVLFTTIGVPTPNLLEEEGRLQTNNTYWNNCSFFINSIAKSQSEMTETPTTNLLTTYLSVIVWSLLNSKLPEILSSLMVSANGEVAFLSKKLLQNLIHLSSVFVCMSDETTSKTAQQAMLSFQSQEAISEEDLMRKARARDCFVDIGSTSTLLYPILESETFVTSNMTTAFSNLSLYQSIMDCFCDNTTASNELKIFDYLCSRGIPFQSFVSESFQSIYQNVNYFVSLVKNVQRDLENPTNTWNWNKIQECMIFATSKPSYVSIFISSKLINKLHNVLTASTDRPEFGIVNLPLSSQSPVYATCAALMMIIMILADLSQIAYVRKTRLFKFYSDQILQQLEDCKQFKNTGLFCLYSIKYTNSYYYLITFLRMCYAKRAEPCLLNASIFPVLDKLSHQDSYQQTNLFILRELILILDITHDNSKAREHFSDFLRNGSVNMKAICLSHMKATFREVPTDRAFVNWAIPLLVSQVSIVSSITTVIVDILFENTCLSYPLTVLINALERSKTAVVMISRLVEARPLIMRLITVSEGFKMFEACDQYVTQEFHFFMEESIYDYVSDVEDGLAACVMQSPDTILTRPIILDGDRNLLVQPLKIQPPSHVVYDYLRKGQRRVEWMSFVPWRIEIQIITSDREIVVDVDAVVNLTSSANTNFFNRDEISIRGVLFDPETHEERSIKIPPGSKLRAYLFVGADSVKISQSCCEVVDTESIYGGTVGYSSFAERRKSTRKNSVDGESTPETQRANMIKQFMMENALNDFEEINYSDVAPRLESVVSNGHSDSTFRYCKEERMGDGRETKSGSCVWKFVVSEGDFKLSDVSMGRMFSLQSVDFIVDFIPHKPDSFVVPPHIFGSLFPTVEGRAILRDGIQFADMCHMLVDEDESLQNRRAILWSLAHIAVLPKGTTFLRNNGKIDFVSTVISMAESDRSLTLRGSCILVLSFLASNPELHPSISKDGWVCDISNQNTICLPRHFESFFENIISSEDWLLPDCDHFIPSRGRNHSESVDSTNAVNTYQANSVTRRGSVMSYYSNISTGTAVNTADSSLGSAGGRRRANSSSSMDSHGISHSMNFNKENQHYLKSTECPSDIQLNDVTFTKEIIELIKMVGLLNSTVYSYEARQQIEDMKRRKPWVFQSPLSLLCIHHMFSLSLFPRGWRKFVFQLFDDITWNDQNWVDFDSCTEQNMPRPEPNDVVDSSSDEADLVNAVVVADTNGYEGLTGGLPHSASSGQRIANPMSYSNMQSGSKQDLSFSRSPVFQTASRSSFNNNVK